MKDSFCFDLKREEKDFVLADGCPSFSGLSGRDMLDLWEITAAFGSSLEDAECCEFEEDNRDGMISFFRMRSFVMFIFKSGRMSQLYLCRSGYKALKEPKFVSIERDFRFIQTKGGISFLIQIGISILEIKNFIFWFSKIEVFYGTVCRADGTRVRPIPACFEKEETDERQVVDFLDNDAVRSNGRPGFSSAVVVDFTADSKKSCFAECFG